MNTKEVKNTQDMLKKEKGHVSAGSELQHTREYTVHCKMRPDAR